jgi:ABC-type uncharacterized transport system substrate-binding protein
MKILKILNGIVALALAGSILLYSDWENREVKKEKKQFVTGKAGENAISGKNYSIGLTYFGPDATLDATLAGLWDGLKELGFTKDSNLKVIAQHANGEISNLQPIHLNMDNQLVDLIVVTSTPGITAAISAVKKHPMVFTMSYTPLEAGAGKSYIDHLPNITGVGSFPPVERTFDFIKDVFPDAKRIGTLYNSSEANSIKVVQTARDYMSSKNLELVETTVINTSEVFQAATALCMRNIDVMWVTGDNTALQAIHGIIKVCRDNRIPLILNDVDYVDQGALAAVGIGWYNTGSQTAPFVARVLNGESPAGIPIINYVEEDVKLNFDVAKELNITFPDTYTKSKTFKSDKIFKFCLAHYVDSPNTEEVEKGIKDGLKNNGFIEGVNYTMKVFNAQGDVSTLNSITEVVGSDKWDLIFASSTPTMQSFSKKIKHTPIVFSNVGDPIRAGLGESFTNHLPNLTGISTMSDFDGLINLVIETMPGIKIVGTVFTPGEINSVAYVEGLKLAAEKRGLTLITVPANTATEVSDAAQAITSRGIQAFTQISDNLTGSCYTSIIREAYKSRIPYFGFVSDQAKNGAVAVMARDYYVAGTDAVKLAIQIINGKSPADIPFRYVSKTSVKTNKEAMKYFNINVPDKLLILEEQINQ